MEEVFYKNNGYFIEDRIPSLFEGMSGEDKKTRRQFWQTVAEIYEGSFSQISDVCSAMNIDLTGHLFEEDQLYRNAVAQGNPINLLKATFEAIRSLRSRQDIERLRGVRLSVAGGGA